MTEGDFGRSIEGVEAIEVALGEVERERFFFLSTLGSIEGVFDLYLSII